MLQERLINLALLFIVYKKDIYEFRCIKIYFVKQNYLTKTKSYSQNVLITILNFVMKFSMTS